MQKKRILCGFGIFLIFLVFIGIIPWAIEFLIFRNNVYSIIGNDSWASFLGSYIGGVIGGAGTLLAVIITTKETRIIQKKNELKIEEDRKVKRREERKIFAYSITEDVAKFLANLALYHDANIKIKECQERINDAEEKLAKTRNQLAEKRKTMGDIKAKETIPYLENREKAFMEIIEAERGNMKMYIATKAPALERATVLNIKLCEIEGAEELMQKVVAMLDSAGNASVTLSEYMDESNKMMDITADFVERYINV